MFDNGNWQILVAIGAFVLLFYIVPKLLSPGPSRPQRRAWNEADELIKKAYVANDGENFWMLQRAVSLAQDSGDGLLASEAACLIGELHLKNKRYPEAAQFFEFALELKARLGWQPDKPNFEALIRRQLDEARAGEHHG